MLRKIKTQQETDRIKRRNQFIIGIAMIGLLLLSTAGFSLISGSNEASSNVKDGDYEFVRDGGLWKINLGGEEFGFQYLPSQTSNVTLTGDFGLGKYSGEPLYFVNSNEGTSEILGNIGDYPLRYQEACLNGATCKNDLPVKSCEDNVIIFEIESEENKVIAEDNCVYIYGDSILGADSFLYEVLKIK